ncbi:MAG: SPOR domain-containing protein [Treponema sp.]|nr:SPOR domain-containing protein [Treponema sp.]
MKKLFLTIGFVFVAGILFTAQSPSLDGRAVVADSGVFPKGLFAKTVGYLPGDTISVTNPANAERVDILVIGSLDPSDGVAIMLSPEAAQELNITKNSNNLVKLTKRNGNADEIANGSAVIAPSSAESAAASEEKPLSQVIEEAMEIGIPVDVAEKQAVAKAEEELADKMFDKADEEIEVQEEASAAEEEDAISKAEEASLDEGSVEEAAAEAAAEEEAAEAVVAASEYPEYEAVQDELVVDELAAADESDAADEIIEDTVIDEPVDEFDAIVLVPSESKAPEAAEADEIPAAESVKEDVAAISSPDIDENPAKAIKSSGVSYVNGYGDLADQKYYVQIAAYKSSENIEQIAGKYADRYPITVVQLDSKSPVLIGPLTVDEYGVVLERFKSYGFKDAFVKVGSNQGKKTSYDAADFER